MSRIAKALLISVVSVSVLPVIRIVVDSPDKQGWDNRTFQLGNDMLIRLPSASCYADKVFKEQYWLPQLEPFLPLFIPTPIAMGKPSDNDPFHWSIYKWIEGESLSRENVRHYNQLARDLAQFLRVLQTIDTIDGPLAGQHNFYRGGDLAVYDDEIQQSITILKDSSGIDIKKV